MGASNTFGLRAWVTVALLGVAVVGALFVGANCGTTQDDTSGASSGTTGATSGAGGGTNSTGASGGGGVTSTSTSGVSSSVATSATTAASSSGAGGSGTTSTTSVASSGAGAGGMDAGGTGAGGMDAGDASAPDCGVGMDAGAANLAGWTMILGDATWDGGTDADIANIDLGDAGTELRANVQKLSLMVHNDTYKRIDNPPLRVEHRVTFQFRLPYVPSMVPNALNGETIEGGLFIWDGADAGLDYGIAFQIIVNPWLLDGGAAPVRGWEANSDLGNWVEDAGEYLALDTDWHKGDIMLNMCDLAKVDASFRIDDKLYNISSSKTLKPTFGPDVAARLQLEIVSINPGPTDFRAEHRAQFKDWSWSWGCQCP